MTAPNSTLWSINSNRAINLASLKSLQQFVLSLNKQELRHLIRTYFQTKLSSNYDPKGTLVNSNEQTLKSQSCEMSSSAIDQSIIAKMNKYQSKYKSKTVSKMQQQKNDKHLLSIPPQLLCYCFQYLPYSENCRLSKVCVYFFYAKKQYNGLSNYYIKLDKSFFYSAVRNRVNLSNLVQFKHIEISCIYHYQKYNGKLKTWGVDNETSLFRYILHQIIDKSKNNLKALTINVTKAYHSWRPTIHKPFNVLLYILNNFKNLSVNKLVLLKDEFVVSTDNESNTVAEIWSKIESKIPNAFHELTHFECQNYAKCIVSPITNHFGCNLRELSLHNPNKTILQLLVQNKLPNIEKLCLLSIDGSDISANKTWNTKFAPQIKELNVSFTDENNAHILSQLFSSFVGLNKFIFTDNEYQRVRRMMDVSSPQQNNDDTKLNWRELFGLLCRQKTIYAMKNQFASVAPLQCIQFNNINRDNAKVILKDLLYLQNEGYFDLKQFGIDVRHRRYGEAGLRDLIQNDLVPFMNKLNGLESLHFSFAKCSERFNDNYMKPFLNILSNIPNSLPSLNITAPHYSWTYPWDGGWKYLGKEIKHKNAGSAQLVTEVCKMAINKTKESQLKSLILDEFKFSNKARDYLVFFFGFNDNISINDKQYCLLFK